MTEPSELDGRAFYEHIAEHYTWLYPDWEAAGEEHADRIEAIAREQDLPRRMSILDATCGVGTQAIPLAKRGHRVVGSDRSLRSLRSAARSARARGIKLSLLAVDLLALGHVVPKTFNLVMSLDNALSNCGTAELALALDQLRTCTAPGGGCLIGVRGEQDLRSGATPCTRRELAQGEAFLFQARTPHPDGVIVKLYTLIDDGAGELRADVSPPILFRAMDPAIIMHAMLTAGFDEVKQVGELDGQTLLFGRVAPD